MKSLTLSYCLSYLEKFIHKSYQTGSLMSHPVFSMKNPNRVRALIGAFAAPAEGAVAGAPTGASFSTSRAPVPDDRVSVHVI
jgi:hypothetical protein